MNRIPGKRAARTLLLVLVTVIFLMPLLWIASSAAKPRSQILATTPRVLPDVADTEGDRLSRLEPAYWRGVAGYVADNVREVWTSPIADFPVFLRNSLIVSTLSVLGMILSSAIVAYGFSRIRWRGRGAVFVLVLATMMIPFPLLMTPLYVLFREIGWIGSLKPLWVPAWFGGAFSIFLFRQFFLTIPRQLDEAAMLDGCSHWGIFWRIILPLSKPAIAVVALFQFVASWNDFVGPLIFLNHQEHYTLALGLFMYQLQQGGTPWNLVMTASILVMLPVLILFILTQRAFVEGVATRGLKG